MITENVVYLKTSKSHYEEIVKHCNGLKAFDDDGYKGYTAIYEGGLIIYTASTVAELKKKISVTSTPSNIKLRVVKASTKGIPNGDFVDDNCGVREELYTLILCGYEPVGDSYMWLETHLSVDHDKMEVKYITT